MLIMPYAMHKLRWSHLRIAVYVGCFFLFLFPLFAQSTLQPLTEKVVIFFNLSRYRLALTFDCPSGFMHRLPDTLFLAEKGPTGPSIVVDVMGVPTSNSCLVWGKTETKKHTALRVEIADRYHFCWARDQLVCKIEPYTSTDVVKVYITDHPASYAP